VSTVGLVVIGRNEGQRLERCLKSAASHVTKAVYVDSGSTDGSVAMARSMGVDVVELDTSVPFTAARARNAGLARLIENTGQLDFVQFVDGDCEIIHEWWNVALARLAERPDLAIVCGRRRERFPEASPYNQMCDLEWNTPVGETHSSGGDFLCRVSAFQQVGGFDPTLIAGEEPELCFRLRGKAWKIERLDAEMTLHDAAMTRLGQWWKREKRSGYATACGASMHGRSPERYRIQQHRSNWLWGALIPLIALAPVWWCRGASAILLLIYPIQWLRIYRASARRFNAPASQIRLYASLLLLGKFPQMLGQLKFWTDRLFKRPQLLIEYKCADNSTAPRPQIASALPHEQPSSTHEEMPSSATAQG